MAFLYVIFTLCLRAQTSNYKDIKFDGIFFLNHYRWSIKLFYIVKSTKKVNIEQNEFTDIYELFQ